MRLEDHEKESVELFGKPFTEVHKWLDEFAHSQQYGMRHRKKRHHLEGLKQIKEIFGAEFVPPARQHIISDLKDEGWTENDRLPKDEKDYVDMGLF